MAILAIFSGKGISKDLYDMMIKEARYAADQPPGAIFHAASFDDQGDIHVADVWASPEELDAYIRERLMPVFEKHNVSPPQVGIYPIHNIDVFKSMGPYIRE